MKNLFLSFIIVLLSSSFALADGGYTVGDKAIDFKLKNVDGKMVSMSDYKDAKGFIVIFTCNHCPYSVLYEDRIIELNRKFEPEGYPVIAINPNDPTQYPEDSYENMIIRAEEKGFNFPYLVDADQSIAKTYGAKRTPHVFLLQKDGNDLIVKYIGAIDDNSKDPLKVEEPFVAWAVEALQKNEIVNPDYTKAVGCSIKWAD